MLPRTSAIPLPTTSPLATTTTASPATFAPPGAAQFPIAAQRFVDIRSAAIPPQSPNSRLLTSAATPTTALLPYRGVRDPDNIAYWRDRMIQLDPLRQDLGFLAEATVDVVPQFSNQKGGLNGAVEDTLTHAIDRAGSPKATNLLLCEGGMYDPYTLVHEWTHTLSYEELLKLMPREIREALDRLLPLEALKIDPQASPAKNYLQFFRNLVREEIFPRIIELKLADRLAAAGEDPYLHSSLSRKLTHDKYRQALKEKGVAGLADYLQNSAPYLKKKIVGLVVSILITQDVTDFSETGLMGLVKQLLGPEEEPLNAEGLSKIYDQCLKPLLQDKGLEFTLFAAGLPLHLAERTFRFFTGQMKPIETLEYLQRDFDELAQGILGLFNRSGQAMKLVESGRDGMKDFLLPPRTRPIPAGDPREPHQRPELAQAKIETLGAFVRLLKNSELGGDTLILRTWGSFLEYAELADPQDGAWVYARLRDVAARHATLGKTRDPSELENRRESLMKRHWQLGLSLAKSGYREAAAEEFRRVLDFIPATMPHAEVLPNIEIDLAALAPYGFPEIAEDYFRRYQRMFDAWVARDRNRGPEEEQPRFSFRCKDPLKGPFQSFLHLYLEPVKAMQAYLKKSPNLALETILREHAEETARLDQDTEDYKTVAVCLESPVTFELGWHRLRTLPPEINLQFYAEAARHWPSTLTDDQLLVFLEEYRAALTRHLATENGQDIWLRPNSSRPLPAARDSYLVYRHRRRMAELLLRRPDPRWHEAGKRWLLALSDDPRIFRNFFHDKLISPTSFHEFQPGLWRAQALLEHRDKLSIDERERLYAAVPRLLEETTTHNVFNDQRQELAESLVVAMLQDGSPQVFAALDARESLLKRQRTQDLLKLPRNRFRKENAQRIRKQFKNDWRRAQMLRHLANAVHGRGSSIDAWATELEAEIKTQRTTWEYFDYQIGLHILSHPDYRTRRPQSSEELERWTSLMIRYYVVSLGKRFGDLFSTIAKDIEKLPLDSERKDALLLRLLQDLEFQNLTKGDVTTWMSGAHNLFEALSFVIGNDRMPKSQTFLLQQLGRTLEKADFAPEDYRAQGLAKLLTPPFRRLGDDTYLERRNLPLLAKTLGASPRLQRSLDDLRSFQDVPLENHLPLVLIEKYQSAYAQGDAAALRELGPELVAALERESLNLPSVPHTVGRRSQYIPQATFKDTLLERIYRDWERSLSRPDAELSEALFALWSDAGNLTQVEIRQIFFYQALAHPQAPLAAKHRIFADLDKLGVFSAWTRQEWKRRKQGPAEAETEFYRLSLPNLTAVSLVWNDAFANLAAESTPAARRRLAEAKARHWLPKGRNHGFDPSSVEEFQLWIARYETSFDNHPAAPFLTLAWLESLRLGKNDDLREATVQFQRHRDPAKRKLSDSRHEALVEQFRKLLPDDARSRPNIARAQFNNDDNFILELRALEQLWQRPPTAEEAALLLEAFPKTLRELERAKDRVAVAGLEIPQAFRDQGELAEFALPRYFLLMPAGKRETLAREMETITANWKDSGDPEARMRAKAEAMHEFLAKAGLGKLSQFLSERSELPDIYRQVFRKTQKDMDKSQRYEAVKILERDLKKLKLPHGPRDVASILANLSVEPMGVGTIADTYESKLADGTPLAVKIITDTRRIEMEETLARLRLLRDKLAKEDTLWAKQSLRLFELFETLVLQELDLNNELTHTRRAYRSLKSPHVRVPRPIDGGLSVMIQEKVVGGVALESIQDPNKRLEIGGWLFTSFLEQVSLGFYHSDLQPANILFVPKEDAMYLIDHGQTGLVTPEQRNTLVELLDQWGRLMDPEIGAREFEPLAAVFSKMGKAEDGFSADELEQALRDGLRDLSEDESSSQSFTQALQIAEHQKLWLELTYYQALKGWGSLEGTLLGLGFDFRKT